MKTEKEKSQNILNPSRLILPGLICMMLFVSSIGSGQISGVYPEGTSSIGRNAFQFSGSYGTIFPRDAFWTEDHINRIGFGAGMGVHETIDLKFSYTRWMVKQSDYNQNAFQLSSKFSSKDQKIAFVLPISMIYSREKGYEGDVYKETIWAVTPRLIFAVVDKKGFDFSILPYTEILFGDDLDAAVTGGLNLGMGFGIIPEMLTFRIEGGIDLRATLSGFPLGTVGFGLYYTIGKGSRGG